LSSNPHALTIHLKFIFVHRAALERFKKCECEDDDIHFHYRTQILGDGHYR
jgi:hypothetical protein